MTLSKFTSLDREVRPFKFRKI